MTRASRSSRGAMVSSSRLWLRPLEPTAARAHSSEPGSMARASPGSAYRAKASSSLTMVAKPITRRSLALGVGTGADEPGAGPADRRRSCGLAARRPAQRGGDPPGDAARGLGHGALQLHHACIELQPPRVGDQAGGLALGVGQAGALLPRPGALPDAGHAPVPLLGDAHVGLGPV